MDISWQKEFIKSQRFKLANELLSIRVSHNLSIEEVSNILGISELKLGQLENGYVGIPIEEYELYIDKLRKFV